MFCPNCGANNLEGAQFCRSCGTNVSLVPQALTGQLPQVTQPAPVAVSPPVDRRGRPITQGRGVQTLFMGFGFACLTIALAITGAGRGWWFWMLIPTFAIIGQAINLIIRAHEYEQLVLRSPGQPTPLLPPPGSTPYNPAITPFPHGDTMGTTPRPFSVTEGTTRHLNLEPPTRTHEPSE